MISGFSIIFTTFTVLYSDINKWYLLSLKRTFEKAVVRSCIYFVYILSRLTVGFEQQKKSQDYMLGGMLITVATL